MAERNHLDTQCDLACNFGGKKTKAGKLLTNTIVVSSKYVALVTHALETAGHIYTSPIRTYIPLLLTLINCEIKRTFRVTVSRQKWWKNRKGRKEFNGSPLLT